MRPCKISPWKSTWQLQTEALLHTFLAFCMIFEWSANNVESLLLDPSRVSRISEQAGNVGWKISVRACLLRSGPIWLSTGRLLGPWSDFWESGPVTCQAKLSDIFWWQFGRKIVDVRCLEDNWMDQRFGLEIYWKNRRFFGRIWENSELCKERYFYFWPEMLTWGEHLLVKSVQFPILDRKFLWNEN